jgi:hypothetical protein
MHEMKRLPRLIRKTMGENVHKVTPNIIDNFHDGMPWTDRAPCTGCIENVS